MKNLTITRNPSDIKDTLDGRTAYFVAGIASPAVFYWTLKRGDKKRLNLRDNKSKRALSGICLKDGKETGICIITGGFWWFA